MSRLYAYLCDVFFACLRWLLGLKKPTTALFIEHCKQCPRCNGDLRDEDGGPMSLCEMGFELFQEDLREGRAL